jgi:VWFA-related protein
MAFGQNPPRAGETITVERILVDTRVTEANGDPILGLEAKDFRVRIDGKPAKIEAAEWVPDTAGAREVAAATGERPAGSLDTPAPAGRLLIFFFQTDFAREPVRLRGQMKVFASADQILDGLEPEDRVAVLSYDSHLKFRLDFSSDRERILEAAHATLQIDDPPRPPLVPSPSLSRHLSDSAMREVTTPEQALFLLGNALRSIPGPKSLILFGWGLGRLSNGRVHMDGYYAVAQRALEQSRTSVFSLDITQADWHSLASGLGKAAADTGGFYAETYTFPQLAVERLQRTLEGHYELTVLRPETKVTGVHSIAVDVTRRGAVVLSRRSFLD